MAPDADCNVRRRREQCNEDPSLLVKERSLTVEGLKNNEVAIDGIIYDLESFVHPGGSSIGVFGGNDVTIQYKMIHAHHSSNKQLEKMTKVGRLVDFNSE